MSGKWKIVGAKRVHDFAGYLISDDIGTVAVVRPHLGDDTIARLVVALPNLIAAASMVMDEYNDTFDIDIDDSGGGHGKLSGGTAAYLKEALDMAGG